MLQKTFRPKTHLCWVVVGQKMEDVMDAEPPFRLLAGHYLYGQCFDHSYIFKLRWKKRHFEVNEKTFWGEVNEKTC